MAEDIKDEIVLNDDELICVLTGNKKKANAKELMLQSIILQMNEEYGFEMSDMKRDYTFSFQLSISLYSVQVQPKNLKILNAFALFVIQKLKQQTLKKVLKAH